jgi:hypothetical protein
MDEWLIPRDRFAVVYISRRSLAELLSAIKDGIPAHELVVDHIDISQDFDDGQWWWVAAIFTEAKG